MDYLYAYSRNRGKCLLKVIFVSGNNMRFECGDTRNVIPNHAHKAHFVRFNIRRLLIAATI